MGSLTAEMGIAPQEAYLSNDEADKNEILKKAPTNVIALCDAGTSRSDLVRGELESMGYNSINGGSGPRKPNRLTMEQVAEFESQNGPIDAIIFVNEYNRNNFESNPENQYLLERINSGDVLVRSLSIAEQPAIRTHRSLRGGFTNYEDLADDKRQQYTELKNDVRDQLKDLGFVDKSRSNMGNASEVTA